ncbi:hypothetical protein [Orbus mooreae]|uniref:hypothetical protein n=1 Tax=Orbus mooreae TaxID=3074107 RepID=UPI00370DDB4D
MTDLLTLINCSYPDFFNSTLKDDDKLVDIYHDEQAVMFHRTNDEPFQEAVRLNTLLKIWRENSKGIHIKIPLLLSGKIWTGIFYSLSSISEDIKMQQASQELAKDEQKFDCLFGDVFSRLVCGMINGVLVEEIRYHQSHYSEELINIILNSKDMATSDNELSYNLSKILAELNGDAVVEKMKHLLPLTSILISCPLLWPFLKSEKQFKVFSLILGDANSDFYNMLKPYMASDNHELVISALPIMGCFSK